MAQETGSQENSGGFFKKNQTNIILGLIILVAVIYFAATRIGDQGGDDLDNGRENGEMTETEGQNGEVENGGTEGENGQQNGENGDNGQAGGNISLTGTLRQSDDASRGNLVLESQSGKIYIATSRDFSSLVGQQVTLQAEGTLDSFRFLGFADGSEIKDDAGDVGGAPMEERNVTFAGTLRQSDDASRGNYMVVSQNSKVYLQSARDYSAWLDSEVTLQATGTIHSFTNALLVK